MVHAYITDHYGVLRQAAINLEGRALRIDRFAVVSEPGRYKLIPFLAIALDRHQPFLARVGALGQIVAAVEFGMHLAQESANVSHQPKCNRIVTTDFFRVDVHMYQLCRRDRK